MATTNPIVRFAPDEPHGHPIAELKQHVLLYVDTPPGPKTARQVLDLYFSIWGEPFKKYASTAMGAGDEPWSPTTRSRFFRDELPELRQRAHWGYSFSDGQVLDSRMLMFHGYGKFTEPDKASFYRFEFEWNVEPERIKQFACGLLDIVECLSGTAGYVFQGRPRGSKARSSFNEIYALGRRYWGVEVQDLDSTLKHARQGYKCVSWLTMIGAKLAAGSDAITTAQGVAYAHEQRRGGWLLQAAATPSIGDRNRFEPMDGYVALATALEPLQMPTHEAFGDGTGSRWTEQNTLAWLRRFTHPLNLVNS